MTRRDRPTSELELGLDLELPEPRPDPLRARPAQDDRSEDALSLDDDVVPATDPDVPHLTSAELGRAGPSSSLGAGAETEAETELDLRLPDLTLPPTGLKRPPATALRAPDEPALELARPVGRGKVASGMRVLEAPADVPAVELARGARRPPRPSPTARGSKAIPWIVVLLLLVAGGGLVAMLAGLSPQRAAQLVRAQGLGGGGAMVTVPGGTFARGCVGDDPACGADEKPPELLTAPELRVGVTEVTVADYAACVAEGACTAAGTRDPLCSGSGTATDLPINCVDAAQAAAFCAARGQRLPTAAEWEQAARGGQALVYPWGGEPPSCARANLGGCGGKPLPVGGRPSGASGQGVLDLAGNVWEWTADGAPARREIRGGSYLDGARTVRASNRGWADARTQIPELGFRCVR